jgi:hypothetical protein
LWYVDAWILVAVGYGSCNINIVRAAYEKTNKRRENIVSGNTSQLQVVITAIELRPVFSIRTHSKPYQVLETL